MPRSKRVHDPGRSAAASALRRRTGGQFPRTAHREPCIGPSSRRRGEVRFSFVGLVAHPAGRTRSPTSPAPHRSGAQRGGGANGPAAAVPPWQSPAGQPPESGRPDAREVVRRPNASRGAADPFDRHSCPFSEPCCSTRITQPTASSRRAAHVRASAHRPRVAKPDRSSGGSTVPPAFSGMTWRSVSGLEGNSTTTPAWPGRADADHGGPAAEREDTRPSPYAKVLILGVNR